jgi:hypothetical protein
MAKVGEQAKANTLASGPYQDPTEPASGDPLGRGFLLPRTQLTVVHLRTATAMHKKGEFSDIAGIETDALCSMYAQVY